MADETKKAKLILGVETKGAVTASKEIAGIGKTAKDVDRQLAGIGKSNALASSFKEADARLEKLTGDIRRDLVGGLEDAARAAGDIKPGGGSSGSSGGGSTPAAAKFRGAAGLVGGGEIIGLIDDLQDLGEGVIALSGDVTKSASAALSAGLAFGVATVAIAVIAAAIKSFADEQAKAADKINSIIDQQRSVSQSIAKGATTDELSARLAELNALREDETARLAELKTNYQQNIESQGALTPLIKLTSGAEDGLAGQIDKSTKLAQDYEAEIQAINAALVGGKTTANDAKTAAETVQQAEVQLAAVRSSTSLDGAREAEKAAREQERIAVEAAREAEKIAAEGQRNTERAAAAQDNYNKTIASAAANLKQAAQDIDTKLSQGLADNLTGLFRDVSDIAGKFRRDTFDQDLKAQQSERDALTDHYRDIDDITEDARKSEREALQEGNFKEAFLARQARIEGLRTEQKTNQREGEDRRRALGDERADLLRGAKTERSIRLEGYERQNADSRLAANRELQQSQLAKQRALEMNATNYQRELSQLGQYLQARNQMTAAANQQSLQQLKGGGISGAGISGAGLSGQGISGAGLGMLSNVIRK